MTGQLTLWDFTYFPENPDFNAVIAAIAPHSKHYCFQLEETKDEKKHFQGRIALRKKLRLAGVVDLFKPLLPGAHWSPTSNAGAGSKFSYVMKADSRVEGPWMDKELEAKVAPLKTLPVKVIDAKGLKPWQQQVKNLIDSYHKSLEADDLELDTRSINVIVDPVGKTGKSSFTTWMAYYGHAKYMPTLFDTGMKIMGFAMDNSHKTYFMDMPRAQPKNALRQLYSAIESLKDGQLYDWRYKGRQVTVNPPAVWVFTNEFPKTNWLSADRWRFWSITETGLAVCFAPPPADERPKKRQRVQEPDGDAALDDEDLLSIDLGDEFSLEQ